ncbi:major intracellular serine protease [Scopulibacillus darangshiensis]|uniref:Major intracellular serine protease n=1 Tax=Scopulibacillus darangshiensis TaxID=442528 RepID=A0A4R2NGU5_9BACL|nr:S8 family peptidase [Scopulibacillus darangshiensis]TCP20334.1 major intracellular serine protease [Scopulibacillus darangshiensis]
MDDLNLIPYTVKQRMEQANETPAGIELIKAPRLWRLGCKGQGIVVAVLDTGCQWDHIDLRGQVIDGRNFTKDYNGDPHNFYDNHYHGTHVAGTIAARENDEGVVGAAPEAKLLIGKVVAEDGTSTYQNVIDGIHYAIDWRGPGGEKVRVISMSLGGKKDDPHLHDAIKRAVRKGIMVVCAAGNNGDGKVITTEITYPGDYPEVVSVGAVTLDKQPAEFSNTNKEIDLVAPGVDIKSTIPLNKYAVLSGTSMATPHVSGGAAVLINGFESKLRRRLTEPEMYKLLTKHTVSLDESRKAEGHGLLDLSKGIKPKK